jgi:phosphoenolpyruvate carboxylase
MNEHGEYRWRAEDQSLRDDVNILGNLLGEILEDLESKALFAHVELARQASIGRHAGEAADSKRFQRILKDLSVDEGYGVCRAFSTYFGLVNLAEQVDRIRRHRAHARTGAVQPESFASALETLRSGGVKARDLRELLSGLQFTPVFTAHPTEAIRRTVLVKEQRIAKALLRRPDPDRESDAERGRTLATIRDEVGIAWQTDEHFSQPSVSDEVEHVLFYLTNVVYSVVPEVYRALQEAVARVYSVELDLPNDLLRFASWVGGDMDGNPHVGADTIRSTLARQHELITRRYRAEVRELFDYLSQSDSRVAPSEEFRDRLAWYRDALPEVGADIPGRYVDMPYRAFLWFVWARLGGRPEVEADAYRGPVELLEDLRILRRSLEGHGGTGLRSVSDLACRVDTFGFHLVTLDIRQDSAVHREALAEALSVPDFDDMGPASRLEIVHRALGDAPTVEPAPGGPLARTLDTMREIRDGRERHGEACFGLYIISMAETADDILAVLLLARMAGLVDDAGAVPLDIAPLFETVDDLDRAAQTLQILLDDAFYRHHLAARGRHQHVMLGYSDSNKEAGLAASRWALQRAQVELVEAVEQSPIDGLELTLFHGRGGTISRGGGKPRDGILAEPRGALRGRLRVTEQGEIIGQKYGLPEMALRTFEGVAGALMERAMLDEPGEDRLADWREVAAFVAERSRVAYREKVYEDPVFMDYFRDATPIDVIERLRIGSRPPARRRNGVEGLRAIPWVFAWTQSRHLFTGWYGVGTGLEAAVDRFGMEIMADMVTRWPFFANLLADTEMVLAKADMGIAEQYAALAGPVGADVYTDLATEFDRACRWICEIKRMDRLLDRDPVLERTIRLRNPYIDPMSSIQLDFLARWRASNREDPELERVLVETVRGIARGMQNTG